MSVSAVRQSDGFALRSNKYEYIHSLVYLALKADRRRSLFARFLNAERST